MSVTQDLIAAYVDRAVEEFSINPLSAEFLRRLAEELPDEFCQSAMRHLEKPGESDAYRMMSTLLLRHPQVYDQIANPKAARGNSSGVVRRLLALDRSFDMRLARKLPDRIGINHREAFTGQRAFRVLDVLDDVSSGTRLVPLLGHLVESGDRKMSAKATLFVGRRLQSAAWAAKLLKHHDQRVRANAVQSLWGMRDTGSVKLLEACLKDENNRVMGNAGFGLHIIDQPGVLEVIQRMTKDPRPPFRSTSAWVMGKIASPGFAADLRRLVKDDSPLVRSTALRALAELRKSEPPVDENTALTAQALQLPEEQAAELAAVAELERQSDSESEAIWVPPPIELRLDGSSFSFRKGG